LPATGRYQIGQKDTTTLQQWSISTREFGKILNGRWSWAMAKSHQAWSTARRTCGEGNHNPQFGIDDGDESRVKNRSEHVTAKNAGNSIE